MGILSRYNIKYNLDGGMDENLINKYISQITHIYNIVNEKYNGYMTDKKDTVILSGSSAILYYLYSLGYKDLIINESFQSPTDVDLLMVYYTKMKPVIDEIYIEDFVQLQKKPNSVKVSSATFKNEWTNNEIKEFDLTYVPFSGTHWNEVNGINVLDLNELKSFYEDDKDLDERQGKDYPKIDIIKQILDRLKLNPRPDIIKKGNRFEISRSKTQHVNEPSFSSLTNKLAVNLFGSTPSDTTTRILSFDDETDNTSPEKTHNFTPRIIDFNSEITASKPKNRKLNWD